MDGDQSMKIMAGMGCIDDYLDYVKAGADEIFVGYVPESWMLKHGLQKPLNRREVLYYNVQIGSFSELLILKEMIKDYKIPVTITLNSLHYDEEDYQEIVGIMEKCYSIGFHRFIIADGDFLNFLFCKDLLKRYEISLSGEYGELNEQIIHDFYKKGIQRFIFPRQTTIEEMKELISFAPGMEFEAFVLNERCQFTGAYCNSMHCDEICHMCQVPYKLMAGNPKDYENSIKWDVPGSTGCGLCALWDLKKAGISHLKLVSRGNGSDETAEDLRTLKLAIKILVESRSREEYRTNMKQNIFPDGCSGNCYYRI